MDGDQQEKITQFGVIAGTDTERSKFFLEASGWNLETALGSFYEEVEDGDRPAREASSNTSGPAASMPIFRTDLSDENSSDEEEQQAFYAGGSVTSGQQLLGPKKNKDIVSKLFKSAKEHGAEVVDPGDLNKGKGKKNTFAGTGYTLGETEDDHRAIPGAVVEAPPRDVVLRMWKNGFTVDKGPLRGYQDPENHEFLRSVRVGKIPMELIKNAKGGTEVYINMEDHREKDYAPLKGKLEAFHGAGNTLGSVAPGVVGQVHCTGTAGGASGSSRIPVTAESSANNEQAAKDKLKVDPSQPTTNIQLRLPDGGRLVIRVNHSHTVGDLRQYAISARPSLPSTFALMTTFPYAELKEDSKSVSDANLLNSSIVIK